MIEQSKKYKIAIIAYNLHFGGLSNVISNLFSLFKEIKCVDVQLLLLDENSVVHADGNVYTFGIEKGKKATFYRIIKKYLLFKKKITNNQLDFILDLRYRINPLSELFITKLIYPKIKIIYTVHSSKTKTYLPENTFLTQLLYGKSYKIVCVSRGNEEIIINKHHLENTTTIYNPLNSLEIRKKAEGFLDLKFEYVIAVGRLVSLKQFDKLIECYSNSILPSEGVKLVIVGDGPEYSELKKLIEKLGLLNNVILIGYSNNPYKYMKNAKFLLLCSKYEGFGIVLTEALTCGIPVISFDLVSGPSEVIKDKVNGLLVENQNFEKLKEAIDLMYLDKILYEFCKSNTYSSVQKFSFEEVTKEWLNLLKIQFDEN